MNKFNKIVEAYTYAGAVSTDKKGKSTFHPPVENKTQEIVHQIASSLEDISKFADDEEMRYDDIDVSEEDLTVVVNNVMYVISVKRINTDGREQRKNRE